MNSILSNLYHGELHPSEHDYPGDSEVSILLASFQEDEKWLAERLDDKAEALLRDLINIHEKLLAMMTYDSFRDGFVLGARLIMEVAGG